MSDENSAKPIAASSARRFPGLLRTALIQVALMLGVTFLLLSTVEGVFRLAGWGSGEENQSVLYYQRISFPLFEKYERADGISMYRSADPRLGHQEFAVEKNSNTFRVFVFGGSATNGLGFSANVTFSHYMTNYLEVIYPEATFEVINCGIIGFSSQQVQRLVTHVNERYDPNLLVVYSGNNEFLEIHARMFMDRKLNARVLRVQEFLENSHTYRALRSGIQHARTRRQFGGQWNEDTFARFAFSESELMQSVQVSPAEYDFTLKKYQKNLDKIVRGAGQTPLIMLTVASNLRWNNPDEMQADWLRDYLYSKKVAFPGNGETDRHQALLSALALLQEENNIPLFQSPHPDGVHYRLGKVYEELGNYGRAQIEFQLARDLDRNSRRALGTFNAAVSFLPRVHPWVQVIDTEEFLSRSAPNGIIGYESFYDYVHFSPEGAQVVAEAVIRRLTEERMVTRSLEGVEVVQPFDFVAARQEFLEALKIRRNDFPEADRWIGFNFDKGEIQSTNLFKFREGIESLKNMAALGRQDPWIFAFLGNASYLALGQAEAALKYYRQGLKLARGRDKDLQVALLENIARLYQRQGKTEKSQRLLAVIEDMRKRVGSGIDRAALDKILKFQ